MLVKLDSSSPGRDEHKTHLSCHHLDNDDEEVNASNSWKVSPFCLGFPNPTGPHVGRHHPGAACEFLGQSTIIMNSLPT